MLIADRPTPNATTKFAMAKARSRGRTHFRTLEGNAPKCIQLLHNALQPHHQQLHRHTFTILPRFFNVVYEPKASGELRKRHKERSQRTNGIWKKKKKPFEHVRYRHSSARHFSCSLFRQLRLIVYDYNLCGSSFWMQTHSIFPWLSYVTLGISTEAPR